MEGIFGTRCQRAEQHMFRGVHPSGTDVPPRIRGLLRCRMSASMRLCVLHPSCRKLLLVNRTQPSMVHLQISVVRTQNTPRHTLIKDPDQQAVLKELKSEVLTCRRSSKNWNLVSRSVIRSCLRVVSAWLTCSRLSTPFNFWSMLMSISCLSKSISARGSSSAYDSPPCTMMLLTPSAPDSDTCIYKASGAIDPREHPGSIRHVCNSPCHMWIIIEQQTRPDDRLPRIFCSVKSRASPTWSP